MSRQYHYVVVWNLKEGRFEVSPETTDANFPNGEVWNEDAECWESRFEIDEMNEAYLDIEDRLATHLNELNDILREMAEEKTDLDNAINELADKESTDNAGA